jgi:hypothetical protein
MESNDQAFPGEFAQGMSKREWYAGLALQGILANPTWNRVGIAAAGITTEAQSLRAAATLAFMYADAMVAQAEQ